MGRRGRKEKERMMCEESKIKSVEGMSERETAYMNTFKKRQPHFERKARLNKKNGHLMR